MASTDTPITPQRAQLLGRLAAERAFLLLRLEGVGESALTHDPVFEGWTVAGLLAHLAYWDAFAADRLMKIAEGRLAEIRLLDEHDSLDGRNQQMRARFTGLNFADGLAMAQKERRGLRLALEQVSDEMLETPVRLRPGWRTTPGVWARRPARHDAEHAADLVRWRANYPPNDASLRIIHGALLPPLLKLSRHEFLTLAGLIPVAERETRPIEGMWTLKQLLGHITDYEMMGIVALAAIDTGREPEYESTIPDSDAFNALRGEVWQARPWAEVWARFRQTRQALLQLTIKLDETALARPFVAPWLGTTTACGFLLDMVQHEHEHADDLRRVLGVAPLPRRLGR